MSLSAGAELPETPEQRRWRLMNAARRRLRSFRLVDLVVELRISGDEAADLISRWWYADQIERCRPVLAMYGPVWRWV